MSEKLLQLMKGKKSLNGWDVAVSYDLKALNAAITDKMWKSEDIFNPVPFELEDGAAQYHMKVYRPIMRFLPREKSAFVTIPIGGVIHRNNKDNELDKGMYNLEVKVPILGILGKDSTGEKPKTQEELAKVTKAPAHTEIHFPVIETDVQKKDKNTYHLTFHFGSIPSKDWNLKSPPNGGSIAAALAGAKAALTGWIAKYLDGVENTIARINDGGDKNTNLQPRSFMFATLGTDEKPILTIYMKVHGGTSEVGQTKVDFFDPHHGISPIPADHTASIIIANEIIAKRIIEHALNDKFGTVTRKGNSAGNGGDEGFEYSIKVKEHFFRQEIKSRENEGPNMASLVIHSIRHDQIDVHLEDHELNLRVINGEATWKLDFWVFFQWEEYKRHLAPFLRRDDEEYEGEVKLEFVIYKKSKINIDSSNLDNDAFSLAASDVQIRASPVYRHNTSVGNTKGVPDQDRDLHMNFKTIEVPMQKINLLLTENVFASNGNLITLDKNYGVKTPHDVLLIGNVQWSEK